MKETILLTDDYKLRGLLFVLLCFLYVQFSNAREIVVDKSSNGIRVVEAKGCTPRSFTDTKVLNIGLQAWVSELDTTWVLVTNVNSSTILDALDDAIASIRTKNGKDLKLYSIVSKSSVVDIKLHDPTVTITVWKNRITNTYNSGSISISRNVNYFKVPEDVFPDLFSGIEQIDIPFANGNYSKIWKKDKIGKVLEESYESIIFHLQQPTNF